MIIKTKSFDLAVYAKGYEKSDKVALVLPGLLDSKDYAHIVGHVDALAKTGFYALSFDPPGTWESDGDISLYTPSNYILAIHETIATLGNRPTFVMGHSRGATFSIATAATNPSIFAYAAIMPSHVKGDFRGKIDVFWETNGVRRLRRDLPPGGGAEVSVFELPYSFFEEQVSYDFSNELASCTKPKLFVYATQDADAPPKRVRELYNAAVDPKEIFKLEGDHNYRLHPKLIEQVNAKILDFLDSIDIPQN